MTHVLVKWITEVLWDVYPVRVIKTTSVAFRLLSETKCIRKLRENVVLVDWDGSQQPAEATLLDFGTEKAMEQKRARLAKSAVANDEQSHSRSASRDAMRAEQVKVLEDHVQDLEQRLQEASNNYGQHRRRHSGRKNTFEPAAQSLPWAANKIFPENLVRYLFAAEELKGNSLYGRGSNKHKEVLMKEALDPGRLNAVIGYTCSKYTTSTVQLKNSLSSMLSGEIKLLYFLTKSQDKPLIAALMMDDMAIKKYVQLVGKRVVGYIDLGTGISDDSLPEATNVCVFMLVGMNYATQKYLWAISSSSLFLDLKELH
ncbi:hypothetical protein MRX96_021524 [Rhipicephalus microplus]